MVAVDFKKAFDTVSHPSLWAALLEQGVDPIYVDFLMQLYSSQSGKVQTDCLSKPFSIERGVRQGDPISPVLFNAALEKLMRHLKRKWAAKRWGIELGGAQKLQNIRFADDLLLISSSLGQARSMLTDLIDAAADFGLEIHESNSKKSFGTDSDDKLDWIISMSGARASKF